MSAIRFPLPTPNFGRELVETCSSALAAAYARIEAQDETFPIDAVRFTLANGIVIAAMLGVHTREGLTKAALDHFAQVRSWAMPQPVPCHGDKHPACSPNGYRLRAEELRAALSELRTPKARATVEAVSRDYERLAESAERIEATRRVARALAS